MKAKEIRALSTDALLAKIADTRHELMNLRFQQITGQLTDTSRLRLLRRDIARMESVLNEQKTAE
jgi:large subunit ribosomal protein L29